MFKIFKKTKINLVRKNFFSNGVNNSGVVLITVIMLILAMMTLALGLLSALASQGVFGQHQIDRIKAEQLAQGIFWYEYIRQVTGSANPVPAQIQLDGKTFDIAVTPTLGGGPGGTTDRYDVRVRY